MAKAGWACNFEDSAIQDLRCSRFVRTKPSLAAGERLPLPVL